VWCDRTLVPLRRVGGANWGEFGTNARPETLFRVDRAKQRTELDLTSQSSRPFAARQHFAPQDVVMIAQHDALGIKMLLHHDADGVWK
jgi:hypothetical protein